MLLQAVYILLWTLLLIVPGIMASYSYAMTGYILEKDDLFEAIRSACIQEQH